jgi:hypothetical protein
MKRLAWLAVVLSLVLSGSAVWAAGDFYVVGGRYAPGTKITYLPYIITAPGYYYLTGNLTYAGGDGIVIAANNVTLDLMGFTITGSSNNFQNGIYIDVNGGSVEVRNGIISGWNNAVGGHADFIRVIGVRAEGNTNGIGLSGNAVITGCTASGGSFTSGTGLYVGSNGAIRDCTVMNFYYGIEVSNATISNNMVLNCICAIEPEGGTTVNYNTVSNCTTGIDASNCSGNIIGNVIYINSGQTGIIPSTLTDLPNVLDQNTVSGAGTLYGLGTSATDWGVNGGH